MTITRTVRGQQGATKTNKDFPALGAPSSTASGSAGSTVRLSVKYVFNYTVSSQLRWPIYAKVKILEKHFLDFFKEHFKMIFNCASCFVFSGQKLALVFQIEHYILIYF